MSMMMRRLKQGSPAEAPLRAGLRRGRPWLLFVAFFVFSCLLSGCGSKTISGLIWDDPGKGSGSAVPVVRTAESQLGKPYRYGGNTPRGFDCSGLIWWAYKQNGITVPRVTTDQANAGFGVSRNAMRPGDILVFNTRQGASGLHTGLYAGGGRFVHSPSRGSRVRHDAVSDAYWSKRLIRVRRMLR